MNPRQQMRAMVDGTGAEACGLPPSRGTGEPAFVEPWQAESLATTVALSQQGLFSWSEWVQVFSRYVREEPQVPGEGAQAAYYRQWLRALEAILVEREVVTPENLGRTKEDWRRSYLHTEHGRPVEFRRDLPVVHVDGLDHHHHAHDHGHEEGAGHRPVTVSPARSSQLAGASARSRAA